MFDGVAEHEVAERDFFTKLLIFLFVIFFIYFYLTI